MAYDFKAATWNVYHGTDLNVIEGYLRRLLAGGVSVFLLQEASQRGIEDLLDRLGLDHIAYDQYVVAWRSDTWVEIRAEHLRLSPTAYFRKGRRKPIYTEAASAILSDRDGRTLTALTYHTPPHVQVKNPPARRIRALREAMGTMKALADAAKTHAVLFGGDDNVDEGRAFSYFFRFMLKPVTGLRQVQAPRPTHGRRRIDDFRVRGLRVGDGSVVPNPSDHHIHIRAFRWR